MLVHYASPSDSAPAAKDWRDELGLGQPSFELPPDFDEPQDALFHVYSESSDSSHVDARWN